MDKIPKIIHYCWFGNSPKNKLIKQCLESWKKKCPDYKIIEWNESNYDITKNQYMYEAYKNKKWAFVTDYARLDIIYEYGGIYLDTDVELLSSLDVCLSNKAFMGFHTVNQVNTGCIVGSISKYELIKELRDAYNDREFLLENNELNLKTCNLYETEFFFQRGLKLNNTIQTIQGMKIYPKEYFAPKSPITGILKVTPKTMAIHHYNATWYPKNLKWKRVRDKWIYKLLDEELGGYVIKLFNEKKRKVIKKSNTEGNPKAVKLLAFYLPQFHEIPENNQWWGQGFTEWVNVKKSRPIFWGQNQPRVPLKDNYYDLSYSNVMEEQMRLAKKYGIYGFCFYHYWFDGKKMLEKPVELLLNNNKAKLNFCLSWANEPWTKAWHGNGGEKKVLIRQKYGGPDQWTQHFNYLLQFFQDKRYIKINNKPMFLIYRINEMDRYNEMLKLWDKLALENGFDGMHIVSMTAWKERQPKSKFISAKTDFVPGKWLRNQSYSYIKSLKHTIFEKYDRINFWNRLMCNRFDYDKVNKEFLKQNHNRHEYRCAFVDFDDTARRGKRATIFFGSTPKKFEKYLSESINKSIAENNEFLFINAWNEWGEGAYLEPDKKYRYGYLNAVKRAIYKSTMS